MANGRIRFGKQSGGQLAFVIPDGVTNTEVIVPESGILATKEYVDDTAVKLTENQTIEGTKTFSSNIVGNITGNANYATSAGSATTANYATTQATSDNSTNIATTAFVKSVVAGSGSATNATTANYATSAGSATTANYATSAGSASTSTTQATSDNSTNIATTAFVKNAMGSGGGANGSDVKTALNASGSAPIYACRAWVNFNGTGTVAIRASGNVSSITDNGVGDYSVNFATAMPNANYSVCGLSNTTKDYPLRFGGMTIVTGQLTTSVRVRTSFGSSSSNNGGSEDHSQCNVSIHI